MPLYGFICQNCQKEFEELVSVSKLDKVTCPECESGKVERQLSLVANIKSGSSTISSSPSCSPGGG